MMKMNKEKFLKSELGRFDTLKSAKAEAEDLRH